MYISANTMSMDMMQDQANKFGAVGWEPVGMASADKTVGFNSNILVLKRRITNPPPPPAVNEDWHPDPTGRFEKRRWDTTLYVWTAETATVSTKKQHVDPPHMNKPYV